MKYFLILMVHLLVQINSEYLHPDCGKGTYLQRRIAGGVEAKKGDWGWQIMLRAKTSVNSFCGGSLINEQWIVTAAHCVYGKLNPVNYLVDIGVQNRQVSDPWTIKNLKVSKIVVNPNYDSNKIKNDIALIKLESPIQIDSLNYKIVPVCLPDNDEYYFNKTFYAIGFGASIPNGPKSNVNMQVPVALSTTEVCAYELKKYNYNFDGNSQVCMIDGYKSVCDGDSGSPLILKSERDGRWHLIGVTSWGYGGCGEIGNIGFFTRVSNYNEWILKTLKQ